MKNNQIFFQNQTGIEGTSETKDVFGEELAAGDFNGDRHADLAVGVPLENIKDIKDAGVVNAIAGSDEGLTADGNSILFQDQPGVEGTSEAYDNFARYLSVGDFDNDGRDDLAVGVPFEDIKDIADAGGVNIFAGSDNGLTAEKSQFWFQDQPGVEGTSEQGDRFGSSVAAGDFNGDSFDDLAVGVPGEAIGSISGGAVNVFSGSDNGLTSQNNQIWFQNQPGVEGTTEDGDRFGDTLAAGDFDGDGFDDLAIAAPSENIGDLPAGAVNIFRGSTDGLTANDNLIFFQDQTGVEGTSENGDNFGESLTAGDFNGDGYDDLAIGADLETIKDIQGAGAVNILNGSEKGLTAKDSQIWFQDQLGVEGTSETFDRFGNSLAAGDFNGDGYDDLAVGVMYETVNESRDGAVNVFNGSVDGLTSDRNQIWFQDQPGIEGTSEAYDNFGSSLSVGDFNSDGYDDLAIGVPEETIGDFGSAGAANIIYGSADGLTA